MRIITLRAVDLVETNVPDSTEDEWSSSTTYATGAVVKVSEIDGETPIPVTPVYEYESLADGNTDNWPPDNPDKWMEIGAENKWKMFDGYTNTETENDDDIEVTITANGSDCVGIFGIYGETVTIRLIRAEEVLKEEVFDLRTYIPESGWYHWLYDYMDYGINRILWDFAKYSSGATLEIVIAARVGVAKCGMVVIGNARDLGITKYDAKIGIDDYSVKSTDDFGRTYLNQGAFADRADVTMWLQNRNVDYVHRQLSAVRGTPAVFDLNNEGTEYQAMAIYGFFQNFDITIPGPIRSQCSLEIKGLI